MVYQEANVLTFLQGGGEMGQLVRSKDWSNSAIGTPDKWPQSLRSCISILLNSQFPMFIWWGPDLTTIYNDAYRIIAAEKHPKALGESGRKVWSEIWDVVGPLADAVMVEGASTWAEDQILFINRHGYVEESYFTFSYSPVYDEAGKVGGVFCACTETTAKVLAARKVEESERNLRNVILQSPVAMCILRGPSFVVEIANSRMFELWGRGADELMKKPIFDGLPEAADKGLEELLMRVYTTGETITGSEQPITVPRNGSAETIYVNFVYEPFREGNGVISGIISIAIDVSDQVVARMRIEKSEAELQRRVDERTAELEQQKALLDNIMKYSPAGITVTEFIRDESGKVIDGKTIMANSISEKHTGIGIEQSLKNKISENDPNILTSPLFQQAILTLKTGEPFITQYYFNEAAKWLELSVAKMDENHLINIFTDVTVLKKVQLEIEESTERLAAVFNTTQSGMFTFAPVEDKNGEIIDFRFVIINPTLAAYVGQTPDALKGTLGSTWFPGYLTNGVFDMYKRTYLTGETQRIDIHYNVDQLDIYLDLKSAKVGGEVLVTFSDYTPLKKAQNQLEIYVQDLKRTNANLEEFAYTASHDLKEPIRKIHFFSTRIKERLKEKLEKDDIQVFERMENATKRMSALIDDLLEYSYLTKGSSYSEEVDLTQKVYQVLEDLELEIEEKHAKIIVEPLPAIKGHNRQLQQLFQNLISNSLKFTMPGTPPEIRISSTIADGSETSLKLSEEAKSKQYHQVELTDKGIGFEQKHADQIFKMFQRLHGKAEYAGTGIGLSIVRKVVENHHGYIWAESQPGKGATFKILFPVE
ncbi:ATP-binding protein [Segetibacter koreensis]|uniref:ATP-binding protein n=1 Tax=Segetibacter koreensis TaxID=398037 RepID=UPI00035DD255|nr:ATP-binding protein [Segetibacter koreensis]